MHQWIKDITGYTNVPTNFDELGEEIRLLDKEHTPKTAQSNMTVASNETERDEIKELN